MELGTNRPNISKRSRMNFNPVDYFCSPSVADRIVPAMGVTVHGPKHSIDGDATRKSGRIRALDSSPICRGKRLNARPKRPNSQVGRGRDGFAECHLWLLALPAAVATSMFARSLKSASPPQLASNLLCADGSK